MGKEKKLEKKNDESGTMPPEFETITEGEAEKEAEKINGEVTSDDLNPFLRNATFINLKKRFKNFRYLKDMAVGDHLEGIYIGDLVTDYGTSLVVQVRTNKFTEGYENVAIGRCRSLDCIDKADDYGKFVKLTFDSWGEGKVSKRAYKIFIVVTSLEKFTSEILE